jgi:hypothetical protein
MRHSEIFDEFAKIAQEKGLISKSTPEEIKKKLEINPRMDSLDISAIEALYGVKPDAPSGMKYKRNIIEDAHQNPVVISPSYDKLNGLVENINERQNILRHIVQKTPNGHLTQRKYAEQQLLLSLVRIGNDLDNKHKEKLRVLADVCLEQATTITKKAIAPAVLATPILIGVAVILGAVYLQQHLPFTDEGFTKNHQKLIAEIDDLLDDNAGFFIGNTYSQNFLNQMRNFRQLLMNFFNTYQKVLPIINELQKPRTASELVELAKSQPGDTIVNAYRMFAKEAEEILPAIEQVIDNFRSKTYKSEQTKEKGVINDLIDRVRFLHGDGGLVADDFDDVMRALTPYKKSIQEILNILSKSKSLAENARQRMQEAVLERSEILPQPSKPETSTSYFSPESSEPETPTSDFSPQPSRPETPTSYFSPESPKPEAQPSTHKTRRGTEEVDEVARQLEQELSDIEIH